VEDDLDLIIDAENLDLFTKPIHFVNFICQMDSYRRLIGTDPIKSAKVKVSEDILPQPFSFKKLKDKFAFTKKSG